LSGAACSAGVACVRALLAKLIRERGEAGDEGEDDYEDEEEGDEEGGGEDRRLVRLLVGSRMLRRRRVRRALLAKLIRDRSETGDEGEEDDDEIGEEGGEEGSDRDRKFLRLVMGSRILRRRRVRRALLAKLIRARGEAGTSRTRGTKTRATTRGRIWSVRSSRLLVGGQMVKRRRARRALVHFLRNRNGDN
jgi:hypothetical protein